MPTVKTQMKKTPSHKSKGNVKRSEAICGSPVYEVRKISLQTRLLLFVRAAGRCEFDGCNGDLLRHHVTQQDGIFGEMAHVVAFKPEGPRGKDGKRPENINDVRNLMLMCPSCHKHIDDHPDQFTRKTLREYKTRHEKRIKYVTSLGPDRHTNVLILKSRIRGDIVQIPFTEILEATAPRYPVSSEAYEIDLSSFSDTGTAFFDAAKEEIGNRLKSFFEPGGEGSRAQHLSVFALAPIPLLIFLGTRLSNKLPTDIYQRHRDTEDWTWKNKGTPAQYLFQMRKDGEKDKVALLIALSGSIPLESIPQSIRDTHTVYEITLDQATPSMTSLRLKQDLENFRLIYQEALGTILKKHGLVESIALFPAIPAPIAVLCGRERMPKVHPRLRVFDYNKNNGGYTFAMEV
jgi:hypothetical protein